MIKLQRKRLTIDEERDRTCKVISKLFTPLSALNRANDTQDFDWLMNLVTLTFVECGDLQKAIDNSYSRLLAAVERFESVAEQFLSQVPSGSVLKKYESIRVDACGTVGLATSTGTKSSKLINGSSKLTILFIFRSHKYGLQEENERRSRFSLTL